MPNALTTTGIVTKTFDELVTEYTDQMKIIYGDDINLAQDTPDGQLMMIFIQSVLDMEDLLKNIFNSFDPDAAIGTTLDRRVSYNGIQRKRGTYTVQPVIVTVSQALNLFGIDDGTQVQEIFTVSDNAGTKWLLMESVNIAGPGSYTYNFRAEFPGAVLTTPNTINVPVSVVLGVTSVNNPNIYLTLGIDEESDFKLKIRRQKSVGLASQGYLSGLLAALENIDGVTSVSVYENNTADTNEDGQPEHSIWVIVSGTAEDFDIATAIYRKRNAGVTMWGDKSYTLTQVDGTSFTIYWDEVEAEALFIKMNLDSIDGITEPNVDAIRKQLPLLLVPGVNETINVNQVAAIVRTIDPNALASNIGLGRTSGGSFGPILSPLEKKNQFTLIEANIILLPMQLLPAEISAISVGDTRQFLAFGGFGAYTWSIQTNESGGSISVGGLYTAGATPSSTDVIRATDSVGNHIDALVGVVA